MTADNTLESRKRLILIVVGLLYSVGVAYLFQSLPSLKYTDDFFPRWYASRMLLTTDRSLYDPANAMELVPLTHFPYENQLGYYYPAYMLLFTAPLALIPYEPARFLWTFLGLWFLWLSVAVFDRLISPRLSANRLAVLLVLITTSVPVFQHTLNGQFNSWGLFTLALTYWCLRQKNWFWAGVGAGGLLFKPQATLLVLLFLLAWTACRPERRSFWGGLALVGVLLWGGAELLERNWILTFWASLKDYVPVQSVVSMAGWNPYQIVTVILIGLTGWFGFKVRHLPASTSGFTGMLVWLVGVNALVVPLYGMLHMVLIGPMVVILLNSYAGAFPVAAKWLWRGVIVFFLAGLAVFVLSLLLTGPSGLQISAAESVYRFTAPILLAILAAPLILSAQAGRDFSSFS